MGEDTDSLRTPIKKTNQNKKNQRRKPNAKYNKTRSSWGEKTVSIVFQWSRLGDRQKSVVGKHWELAGGGFSHSSTPGRAAGNPQPMTGPRGDRAPGEGGGDFGER